MITSRCSVLPLLLLSCLLSPAVVPAAGKVDYQRDVRPLLSGHCFKCHGPDELTRKGGLRLDVREEALRPAKSGAVALVPGKPKLSELVTRVFSTEAADVMPPPETKHPLTPAQKEILRQWVAEGARYEAHWAFVPPQQAPLPRVSQKRWVINPVDAFVLARLDEAKLKPSPPADRHTLVRRVYLDLLGLPPTPEEVAAFVNDPSPDAYEQLVDRLLGSVHYGERWARRWLDLARYADTNGYEKDRPRSIWPYRDWVINALNRDLPFDQFTIEQLAGDLLPNATLEQRVATGFHRNTMLNEEGGIDPLEFRFHAMTDRVATTGTTWLGLTIGCAQCHTHKYDPVTHREYYQLMALLNNADEPDLDLPDPAVTAKRREHAEKLRQVTDRLADQFPVATREWRTPKVVAVTAASGVPAELKEDGVIHLGGKAPEQDTYTVELEADLPAIGFLRLEALTDDRLPQKGPGRADGGNFVLSEISVVASPKSAPDQGTPVRFSHAEADFSQVNFAVTNAIDGQPRTGWAVANPGKDSNVPRTAIFTLAQPLELGAGTRLVVRLEQQHGRQLVLGRFRLSVGRTIPDSRPIPVRRAELIERGLGAWLAAERARTVRWEVLRPGPWQANLALLTVQPDHSLLATGDQSKSDTYAVRYRLPRGTTALRLEALPDDRLPAHGPGATYYEGPKGDFFLSEFTVRAGDQPLKLVAASDSYGKLAIGRGTASAANCIDGDPQSGWSVNGRQGERSVAVFRFAAPLAADTEVTVGMLFEKHYAAPLGRFRLAATTAAQAVEARSLAEEVEALLLRPAAELTAADQARLRQEYLLAAPELAAARAELEKLRRAEPDYPTTLVLRERPATHQRPTFRHHRGEYLQPKEPVAPGGLAFLPPLPAGAETNRLTLARWLVSRDNPLTARVTVNRQWAVFFGRGLVRTTEDFGLQGELPTHPELLDWLAVEFMNRGWSLKQLHRLIVLSATYRQASTVTPVLLARDPENKLLARGPRVRLDAELVRDTVLRVSGLLSDKVGGPSVYPPQPESVTTEGAYGKLDWKVSQGPDRYRRGLYTFTKRTAPYAMFSTFDAPSGEACVARRDVSNTPLQALTLLNDTVFLEAAQALGRRFAAAPGTPEERLGQLFLRCLGRPPRPAELTALQPFLATQQQRLRAGDLPAAELAGTAENDPAAQERAAWTLVARAVLNLDELITRE